MTADFAVTRSDDEYGVTVALSGPLDVLTASECAHAMDDAFPALAPDRTFVIDLRDLEFLGVAGARVLLDAARTCARIGAPMYIVTGPDGSVHMVLAMLDEGGILTIVEDLDDVYRSEPRT